MAHEVNINVKESEAFGKLVDDIMKVGVNKVNSLELKPKEVPGLSYRKLTERNSQLKKA